MKKWVITILLTVIISSPSILILDSQSGVEKYGPDYYDTLDYFSGPTKGE